jgi:hypothetical protein
MNRHISNIGIACCADQGAQLEPDMGSGAFAVLVAELLTLSHVVTVMLAAVACRLMPDLAGLLDSNPLDYL